MDKESVKPVIESLLFAAEGALTLNSICNILEGVDRAIVRAAVKELMDDYNSRRDGAGGAVGVGGVGGGMIIEEVAGGFQMRTNPANSAWVRRLFKTGAQKVSRAAMETLAVIAYKQPVTRGEIELIRGVDSGGVLQTLMEKRLIKIAGRKDAPGRPVVYATTKEFLETFDLKDLGCLPSLKEIKLPEEGEAGKETDEKGSEEVREASEDNSRGGDNLQAEGGGADNGGEGQGKREGSDGARDQG